MYTHTLKSATILAKMDYGLKEKCLNNANTHIYLCISNKCTNLMEGNWKKKLSMCVYI